MDNFYFELTSEQVQVLSVVFEDYSHILEHIGYHFRRNSILSDSFLIDVITLRTEFDIQSTMYANTQKFEANGNKGVSKSEM